MELMWLPKELKTVTYATPPMEEHRKKERKTGDVVAQWLENRNSNPKTLGSIPWRDMVRNSLFLSLQVNSCADVFVPDPPLCVYGTHPKVCAR